MTSPVVSSSLGSAFLIWPCPGSGSQLTIEYRIARPSGSLIARRKVLFSLSTFLSSTAMVSNLKTVSAAGSQRIENDELKRTMPIRVTAGLRATSITSHGGVLPDPREIGPDSLRSRMKSTRRSAVTLDPVTLEVVGPVA
ncbi:MAG: hypothetical protein BWY82_01439 [Verrucomicrobia bacterium ADurb.Bin474]|nr:MAG: hypothetical protein BWY82_01439 [Verrucomicrobia bacterium ADurb.Bin474]